MGEGEHVSIWEALAAVKTLIQYLKFQKRTAESGDREWMSGQPEEAEGEPLGETDPWSRTDQDN